MRDAGTSRCSAINFTIARFAFPFSGASVVCTTNVVSSIRSTASSLACTLAFIDIIISVLQYLLYTNKYNFLSSYVL